MSHSDLASVGSFVSGVGVLVSLLLLFFQLRQVSRQIEQAERNQQAAIQQERYGRVFEVNLAMTDPALADATEKGMGGSRDMSPTEIAQFRSYSFARFQISENTFLQHQAGLMSDAAFAAFKNAFVGALGAPGVRVMWKWAKPQLAADFVAFGDALIPEAPPSASVDLRTRWIADLAAEA